MEAYILIMLLGAGNHTSSFSVEFNTYKTCEVAVQAIEDNKERGMGQQIAIAFCVKK